MNRSSGNMYDFTNEIYTYNPVKGECSHNCGYCYMKPIRWRYHQDPTLRLDLKELKTKMGKNRFVFLGSSTDMFAADVPSEWIVAVMNHLYDYPENEYMFQSKNPARFLEFVSHKLCRELKEKLIFCTTMESDIDHEGVSDAPLIAARTAAMKKISSIGFKTMITVEPVMKFSNAANFADLLASVNPIQVNIGANTNRQFKLIEPDKAEILSLIKELEGRNITVHQKSNLERLLK